MKIDLISLQKDEEMKTIEINSKTDKTGLLKIDYHLGMPGKKVRVLILIDDASEPEEENLWLKSISENPVFDFLNDPAENIYSLNDGESFND